MTRFSYAQIPAYPVNDCIDMIKLADELGFYACYSVDETYHKDMWSLFAAAADKTRNIRLGPAVTHVILREPTLIAQHLATLDELTGGRAEAVVSFGNLVMLAQYHIAWQGSKPLSRLREGLEVMRTFLDEGAITYEGEFFNYTGMFTAARPVQEHLPLKVGAMGGPKSFEFGGEVSDGVHHACGYSRENYDYVVKHVKAGAAKAGRNGDELDIGAWLIWSCGPDSKAAKAAARIMAAFYIPAMPQSQIERHGIDYESLKPISEAFGAGDVAKALELTTPEIGDQLSVAGTPEECVEKLKNNIIPAGVNHIICCVIDPYLVKHFSGAELSNVPDVQGQLRLIHDEVIPAFN